MVQESLYAHTCETYSFNGWEPPIEGFELGLPQSGESRDIEEVLSAALRLTSFLHRPEAHQKRCQEPTRVKWASSVRSHLIERDDRLRPLVNARVRLSKVNVPCVFSFLSDNYAANLVSFVGRLQESCAKRAGRRGVSTSLIKHRASCSDLSAESCSPACLTRGINTNLPSCKTALTNCARKQVVAIFKSCNSTNLKRPQSISLIGTTRLPDSLPWGFFQRRVPLSPLPKPQR